MFAVDSNKLRYTMSLKNVYKVGTQDWRWERMTRGALLDVAAGVAWRYQAYDSYDRETRKAMKAIRRKWPEFSEKQCENALIAAIRMYVRVEILVNEHADEIWRIANQELDDWTNLLDKQLKKEFPAFWL